MILQDKLPIMPWMEARTRRLPGVQPVDMQAWLLRDEAYAAQMAYRDRLIATRRNDVYVKQSGFEAAAAELLAILVDEGGYARAGNVLSRPDGVEVDITADEPLVAAGRLVQEDLVILQADEDVHSLTAGLMCFPASWTPRQKLGKTLTGIHRPVPEYGAVGDVVQRMFHALRPEQPLMRANFLIYTDPELHQPRSEGEGKPFPPGAARYVRTERQTFRKLPNTQAVVFAIHTSIVPATSLPPDAYQELAKHKPALIP